MKYTAKILFISIAVLYVLVMLVSLGLLAFQFSREGSARLVSSETAFAMAGLWLTIPVGLGTLVFTLIRTVRAGSRRSREVKTAAYMSGSFVIGATLLLAVFLLMTVLGILHPRQVQLTITTVDVMKSYDGTPLVGSTPEVTHGQLREGHRLEVLSVPQYTQSGQYPSIPQYRILDENDGEVTDQYQITENFGIIQINPRKITLTSAGKSKIYDGEPLTADPVVLTAGTLVEGHELVVQGGNAITLPGSEPIRPVYSILSAQGDDLTDQYEVLEDVGTLTVEALAITLTTDSGTKAYDGKPLSAPNWHHTEGSLLEGHSIQMELTAVLDQVGTLSNGGKAQILDADGQDMTHLYNINYQFGTLRIQPIALYITTMSAEKIYDGHSLQCPKWELTRGMLQEGCTIKIKSCPTQKQVGTMENTIEFMVEDAQGQDVTDRYVIVGDYGTLTLQPRTLTLRTDSAEKVYDGKPLSCNTFQVISGELCDGHWIELVCVSITNVGYSENYVLDCTVYRKNTRGESVDVSSYYRISFDFGVLKITDS